MDETMSAEEQVPYQALLDAYEASPKFKKAWRKASNANRERFINEILRGAAGAALDEAVELVELAFAGRPKILVKDLQRLAVRRGFHKSAILKIIRERGYKKKRLSRDRNESWWYMNPDKEGAKGQIPEILAEEYKDHRPPKPRRSDQTVVDHDDDDDDDDDNDNDNKKMPTWRAQELADQQDMDELLKDWPDKSFQADDTE